MPYRVLSIDDLTHPAAQTNGQVMTDMTDALTAIEASGMKENEVSFDGPRHGWTLTAVVDQFEKELDGEDNVTATVGPFFIFHVPRHA